jgi:hypothetical protein
MIRPSSPLTMLLLRHTGRREFIVLLARVGGPVIPGAPALRNQRNVIPMRSNSDQKPMGPKR